jgi:putative ABC transport system permease protein
MYRNYIKIAWRNLRKSKGYSVINIAGLATGMAVALLIGLWIWDEVSFDDYFKNKKSLGQVMVTQSHKGEWYTGKSIAVPIAAAIRNSYSDDISKLALASFNTNFMISAGEKKFSGSGLFAQPDFPGMFTFKMLHGSHNGLKDPSAIMIAASLAEKLFGDTDPLNAVVKLNNKFDMKVAGVYEDFPFNSSFYDTKMLLPWDNNENWNRNTTEWDDHSAQLFVQLAPGADFDKTNSKIKNIPTAYIKDWHEELLLHPMDKLYLYGEFTKGKATGGRILFIWLFGTIGVFVLLLACINFMNLSTARSEQRGKEVGIRKAVGSLRRQLIAQFLGESVLITFLAFLLSLVLVQLSLPFFNSLSGKQTTIPLDNPAFWIAALVFSLFTGLVAGSYPAFYLSGFDAIKVLKGTFKVGRFASIPRKVLVVTQFTVSITLIIGTVIVYRQIQHAKSRPVGYSRDGLISVWINTPELSKNYDALRTELLREGAIENMSASSYSPVYFSSNNSIDWKGKDPALLAFFRNVNVSHDFGKTIRWTMKEGRDFSRDFPTDSSATILSEAAAKIVGLKNIIGETVKYDGKSYTVIGVVKDMLTQSPYDPIDPTIYFMDGWKGVLTIRLATNLTARESLDKMKPIFKKYNPESGFSYSFVDEEYGEKFANEERIGSLATFFAALAIFISCLGLFGLASFVAAKRTKEIGVRKVLGASVFIIWRLLSKEFVLLVTISLLIAIPISYYFMNNWLENYKFRTTITWWIFAATGMAALVITLLTVSFQAIRAALSNPVKALRSE